MRNTLVRDTLLFVIQIVEMCKTKKQLLEILNKLVNNK